MQSYTFYVPYIKHAHVKCSVLGKLNLYSIAFNKMKGNVEIGNFQSWQHIHIAYWSMPAETI